MRDLFSSLKKEGPVKQKSNTTQSMNSCAASMCLEENLRQVGGCGEEGGGERRKSRVGGERKEREVGSLCFSSNIPPKSV